MNILGTQYTLSTKSLEIYVAGCKGQPHCSNCHNEKSWDFNQGTKYNREYFVNNIMNKANRYESLVKNIMIFGGEPLDQNLEELKAMLSDLKELNLPIWIFTRYELKNIPSFIKEQCQYIKTGRYVPSLSCEDNIKYGIKLATSNQTIYKQGLDY